MNPVYKEQLESLIRKAVTAIATYLMSAGFIDSHLLPTIISETTAQFLGLALAGISLAWSWWKTNGIVYFRRNLAIAGATLNPAPEVTAETVLQKAAEYQAAGSKPGPINTEVVASTNGQVDVIRKAMLVLALCFGVMGTIACGGRSVTTTPDQAVTITATYGKDAVKLVTAVQNSVNEYAKAQGGRTPATDKVSNAIRDEVIPVARNLESAFNRYVALRKTGVVPNPENVAELTAALNDYEKIVEAVLKRDIPDNLVGTVATTVSEIAKLVQNIRRELNLPRLVTDDLIMTIGGKVLVAQ